MDGRFTGPLPVSIWCLEQSLQLRPSNKQKSADSKKNISLSQNNPVSVPRVCAELRGPGHLKSLKSVKSFRRKIDALEPFEEAVFGEIDVRFIYLFF